MQLHQGKDGFFVIHAVEGAHKEATNHKFDKVNLTFCFGDEFETLAGT